MRILVAVHDLMFSSKINAAAKGGPHEIAWLPRGASVVDKVREAKPDALVIDLGNAALRAVEAIQSLKASDDTKGVHVIAYAGHTEEATIAAARAAGCDELYSKGEFAQRLPMLLGAAR